MISLLSDSQMNPRCVRIRNGWNANLLTPWSRVLLEKLTGSAASQEIPRIFGTPKFFTVLTSARQLYLSWTNSIQSPQPPPTSWRSILILSSHLGMGLPNGLFPSGFPTRTLCTPLPSPIRADETLTLHLFRSYLEKQFIATCLHHQSVRVATT